MLNVELFLFRPAHRTTNMTTPVANEKATLSRWQAALLLNSSVTLVCVKLGALVTGWSVVWVVAGASVVVVDVVVVVVLGTTEPFDKK